MRTRLDTLGLAGFFFGPVIVLVGLVVSSITGGITPFAVSTVVATAWSALGALAAAHLQRPPAAPAAASASLRPQPSVPVNRGFLDLARLDVLADELVVSDAHGAQATLPRGAVHEASALLLKDGTRAELHLRAEDGRSLFVLPWGLWFPGPDTGPAERFAADAGLAFRQGTRRQLKVPDADTTYVGDAPPHRVPHLAALTLFPSAMALLSAVVTDVLRPATLVAGLAGVVLVVGLLAAGARAQGRARRQV